MTKTVVGFLAGALMALLLGWAVFGRSMEHQNDPLDTVCLDQELALAAVPLAADELGTTRGERPGTSGQVDAIAVVYGEVVLEELIDFLLKSPIRAGDHQNLGPLLSPRTVRMVWLHDL